MTRTLDEPQVKLEHSDLRCDRGGVRDGDLKIQAASGLIRQTFSESREQLRQEVIPNGRARCAPQLFGADAYQSIARLASAQCDVIA